MKNSLNHPYLAVFALIGFSATTAQIIFVRELLSIFLGNEISIGIILANWLFWTAIGSYWGGKLINLFKIITLPLILFQILLALMFPLTIILIRFAAVKVQSIPGEIVGVISIFWTSLLLLSGFCLISGVLFALASNLFSNRQKSSLSVSTGFVYVLESTGATIAGVVLSLFLIENFNGLTISAFVSVLNLVAASLLTLTVQTRWIKFLASSLNLILIVLFFVFTSTIEQSTESYRWQSLSLLDTYRSKYGKLSIIEDGTSKTVYENGVPLFSIPDKQAAEEAVHFSLLQHPHPQNILLIGGGISGAIEEILQYREIQCIDYVELDPKIIEISQIYFPESWNLIIQNPLIHIHHVDGRRFLQLTDRHYDLIILNLPDPNTAQLNRFYTEEFFRQAKQKLSPDGILSLQAQASENYINEALADYLRCLHHTLNSVFPEISFIPGDKIHFFASRHSGQLTQNSEILLQRLHERKLNTQYIREYYIPYRLSTERIKYFREIITATPATPSNRDFSPIAYYFNMILWGTQFSSDFVKAILWFEKLPYHLIIPSVFFVYILLLLITQRTMKKNTFSRLGSMASIICMGFSAMGTEILILLIFQSLYGYVYHQFALLIALFMAGIAFGGWISLKNQNRGLINFKRTVQFLLLLHIGMSFLVILLPYLFGFLLNRLNISVEVYLYPPLFMIVIFLCGGLSGFHFPKVSKLYYESSAAIKNAGTIYGLDLCGAVLGSLLLSSLIIPLFGFYITSLLIAGVNVLVLMILGLIFLPKNFTN